MNLYHENTLSICPIQREHSSTREVLDVQLIRMRLDGSEKVLLRKLHGGQGTINSPSWSPDSKYFAFVEYKRKKNK